MKVGFYSKHPKDYDSFEVPLFKFPNVNPFAHCGGCGASALRNLGCDPFEVRLLHGSSRKFSDKFMVNFLRKKGYKVIPITQCLVSNTPNIRPSDNIIRHSHVVLMCQLYHKNEASWTVAYQGELMHNNEVTELYPMEFVNRPILSAYMIFHPAWKTIPAQQTKPIYVNQQRRKKTRSSRK